MIAGQGYDNTSADTNWEVVKAWNEALAAAGCARLGSIEVAGEVGNAYWFIQYVCPRQFLSERRMGRWTPDELGERKREAEENWRGI